MADKLLRNKGFNIAKNPNYDGYQRRLASVVYTVFDKKTSDTNRGTGINSGIVSENKELAKQLLKPIVRKFEKKIAFTIYRQ